MMHMFTIPRHRPAWAKPDLPPGRAFGDVLRKTRVLDAFGRPALISLSTRPPEVGLAPCGPHRQEFDQ